MAVLLQYATAENLKQITNNMAYLLHKKDKMKTLEPFVLQSTLNVANTNEVDWKFLEEAVPKLNKYFMELWMEYEKEVIDPQIEDLKLKLKDKI